MNAKTARHDFRFLAKDEHQTERLGAMLARALPDGTTVALIGTLGAGKTRLVRAVARACGVAPDAVVSPTFVLCQEYCGRRTIYHLDAYRLRDEDEFLELGPEEYFESCGITLVEWADRVLDCLPPDRIEIRIEVVGETARAFTVTARGERLATVPETLKAYIGDDQNAQEPGER